MIMVIMVMATIMRKMKKNDQIIVLVGFFCIIKVKGVSIMSSYLVTGGAGFIGLNIVHELVRRNQTVSIVDNFSHREYRNHI